MLTGDEKLSVLAQKLRGAGVTKITHDAAGVPTFYAHVGLRPAKAGKGRNRGPGDEISAASAGQLKAIIERVEHLEEDKRAIAGDIKEVYAEAKGNGFDVKTLRKIVRLRAEEPAKRRESEAILETYLRALGME